MKTEHRTIATSSLPQWLLVSAFFDSKRSRSPPEYTSPAYRPMTSAAASASASASASRLILSLLLATVATANAADSSSGSNDATIATTSSSSGSSDTPSYASGTVLGVFYDLNKYDGIQVGGGVLAALGILLGAVAVTSGFRLFKPVVATGALVTGGYLIALAVEQAVGEDNDFVVLASWLAFGIGGLVFAGLIATVDRLGNLFVGAATGVLFAGLLNVGIGHKIDSEAPDRLLLALQLVLGLLFAIASLDTVCLILALSFSGAFLFIYGIGFFAGSFPIGEDLAAYRQDNETESWLTAVPVAWWIYLAVFLLVFGIGAGFQVAKAREHGYHDENGKFVYAAYSDDDVEDDDRKSPAGSPRGGNFQHFAPYQPPSVDTYGHHLFDEQRSLESGRVGSNAPSVRSGSNAPSVRSNSTAPSGRTGSTARSGRTGSTVPSDRIGSNAPAPSYNYSYSSYSRPQARQHHRGDL